MKDHDGEHLVALNIEWDRFVERRDLLVLSLEVLFWGGDEIFIIRFVSERACER